MTNLPNQPPKNQPPEKSKFEDLFALTFSADNLPSEDISPQRYSKPSDDPYFNQDEAVGLKGLEEQPVTEVEVVSDREPLIIEAEEPSLSRGILNVERRNDGRIVLSEDDSLPIDKAKSKISQDKPVTQEQHIDGEVNPSTILSGPECDDLLDPKMGTGKEGLLEREPYLDAKRGISKSIDIVETTTSNTPETFTKIATRAVKEAIDKETEAEKNKKTLEEPIILDTVKDSGLPTTKKPSLSASIAEGQNNFNLDR